MGLTPYEYYCLAPYEFLRIVEGYLLREAKFHALIRKHAQVVYASAGGKENIQQYWSIPLVDGKQKSNKPSPGLVRKIMNDAWRQEMQRRSIENR